MAWSVEYTDEFGAWFSELTDAVQDDRQSLQAHFSRRRSRCACPPPRGEGRANAQRSTGWGASGSSRTIRERDVEKQASLSAEAIALFYERMIPVADRLYDTYLVEIGKEGLLP